MLHLYDRCEWNGNLGVLWFYEFINTFVRSNYAIWWMMYEMVKLILRNNYEYKECMGCVCVLCACQMCSKMFTYKLFYAYVYMRFILTCINWISIWKFMHILSVANYDNIICDLSLKSDHYFATCSPVSELNVILFAG